MQQTSQGRYGKLEANLLGDSAGGITSLLGGSFYFLGLVGGWIDGLALHEPGSYTGTMVKTKYSECVFLKAGFNHGT